MKTFNCTTKSEHGGRDKKEVLSFYLLDRMIVFTHEQFDHLATLKVGEYTTFLNGTVIVERKT